MSASDDKLHVGNVAKKVRKVGEPSQSSPPADAPQWSLAVGRRDNETSTGTFVHVWRVWTAIHILRTFSAGALSDITNLSEKSECLYET